MATGLLSLRHDDDGRECCCGCCCCGESFSWPAFSCSSSSIEVDDCWLGRCCCSKIPPLSHASSAAAALVCQQRSGAVCWLFFIEQRRMSARPSGDGPTTGCFLLYSPPLLLYHYGSRELQKVTRAAAAWNIPHCVRPLCVATPPSVAGGSVILWKPGVAGGGHGCQRQQQQRPPGWCRCRRTSSRDKNASDREGALRSPPLHIIIVVGAGGSWDDGWRCSKNHHSQQPATTTKLTPLL